MVHKVHGLMNSFSDILDLFDGPSDLSDAIGVGYQTARKMIERRSIAPRHWTALRAESAKRGQNVTLEQLLSFQLKRADERAGAAA